MKTLTKKTIETVVEADVTCDVCGASTLVSEGTDYEQFSYGVLKFHGQYGSDHDCQYVEMQICETCVFKMVEASKTAESRSVSPWGRVH
jgi:hypothetical protein